MYKDFEQYPIDIVVPWVDSSDPIWRLSRNKYASENEKNTIDNSEVRYRDWGTLKYLFRGIEQYAPWIKTVHLITMNQYPAWLNVHAQGLHIVDHRDFIPEEYLPTFSSHTIELNIHRIPDLTEHFLYFNDDILILKPLRRTDYFEKGLPKDCAIHTALTSSHRKSVMDVALTNIEIINEHYEKHRVIKKYFFKWYNLKYGTGSFRTLLLSPWRRFSDIQTFHSCVPFLKSTFFKVWEKEFKTLDETCRHKFRTCRDVNQWLIRDWQLVSGNFIPKKSNASCYYKLSNDNSFLYADIKKNKYEIACINDSGQENIIDFEKTRRELISHIESALPKKSRFEL